METTNTQRNSIQVAKYTMGFKSYKLIKNNDRVKIRQVRICRNGKCIYADVFKEEEKARHEQWASNFLNAMKLHDTKQYMSELNTMKGI